MSVRASECGFQPELCDFSMLKNSFQTTTAGVKLVFCQFDKLIRVTVHSP